MKRVAVIEGEDAAPEAVRPAAGDVDAGDSKDLPVTVTSGGAELTRERAGASQVTARDEQRHADPPGRRRVTARDPPAAEEDESSQGHEF